MKKNQPNEFWHKAHSYLTKNDYKTEEECIEILAELLSLEYDNGYQQGQRDRAEEIKKALGL